MLTLILALVALDPSSRAVLARDFAKIPAADALSLDGRAVVLRLERDSLTEEDEGIVSFDCDGPDDLHRTCCLLPGEKVGTQMTVAGRLRVIRHGRSRDGLFPAFLELRLTDGRVLGVEKE
jgi:hypothetical protein